MRIASVAAAATALAITAGLGFAGPARSSNSFGPKVSDALAAAATAQGVSSSTWLHAIVYGNNLKQVNADLGSNMTVRQQLGGLGGESISILEGSLSTLAAENNVAYVDLDRDIATTGASPPSPGALVTQYPVIDNAPALWSQNITGNGLSIGIVDSGTTVEPDFGNRLHQDKLNGQQDGDGALNDPFGHGSFVAGVAAGQSSDGHFIGIAPGANIEAFNMSRPDGVRTSDVMAALMWILQNGNGKHIRVVNLSLTETTASSYLNSPLDAVVERLWRAGIVVVVSAGNKGPGTTSYAPANDPFVITVGASDSNGTVDPSDDTLASFSSSGNTQDGFYKPELLAPGRKIGSLLPAGTVLDGQAPSYARLQSGYVRMSGTSFSAPQVSGAVALLLQEYPKLTPDQVKYLLTTTTTPVQGSPVGDLNIAAAAAAAPSVPAATQNYPQAHFSASAPPAGVTQGPAPQGSGLPLVSATQPATPVQSGKKSVPDPNSPSCSPCKTALQQDAQAAAYPAGTKPDTVAGAWEKAASSWENAPYWANAALDYDRAAAIWEGAAQWDHAQNDRGKADQDWEKSTILDGLNNWLKAGASQEAEAADLERKGNSLQQAAQAWDGAEADRYAGGDTATEASDAGHAAPDWEQIAQASDAAAKAKSTQSAGDYEKAGGQWDSAWNDRLLGSADPTSDLKSAATDYDTAAHLQTDPHHQLADQQNAAPRWDTAATSYENSGNWSQVPGMWDNAANDWQRIAQLSDQSAQTLQQTANQSKNPSDYAKAAAAWDASGPFYNYYASAYQREGAGYDKGAAWDKGAAAWDKGAAAWDKGAGDWNSAGADWTSANNGTNASSDAASATANLSSEGAAQGQSASDWDAFGSWNNSAGEYQKGANTYQKAAAWDQSAADWERSAMEQDKGAAWDQGGSAWDKAGAAWDQGAAWDKAAADYDNSANDYSNESKFNNAATELNTAGFDWTRAAAWDKAAFDWALAATDNPSADWNNSSGASGAWQADSSLWN